MVDVQSGVLFMTRNAASYRKQVTDKIAEDAREFQRGKEKGKEAFLDGNTRMRDYHISVPDNVFSKGWMEGWCEGRREQLRASNK